MKIKWLGHAAFFITSNAGIRIITDPYMPEEGLDYRNIDQIADIVTVSHEHLDHNNVKAVRGDPVILKEPGEARGIAFRVVQAFHDTDGGKKRGQVLLFCFTIDGVRLCHLGDLGHVPDHRQLSEIGAVDILMIPAGGYFTIEPDIASQVVSMIRPKVVIPMHFQTDRTNWPIAGVDKFLKGKTNVRRLDTSEIEFEPETLPSTTEIIVLKPAL